MRTNVELLKLILEVLPKVIDTSTEGGASGICDVVDALHIMDEISSEEYNKVSILLQSNIPDTPRTRNDLAYWWDPKEMEPRIEFLNELIKNYE